MQAMNLIQSTMKKYWTLSLSVFVFASAVAQVNTGSELKQLINKSFGYFPKVKEVENGIQTATDKLKLTELNRYPDVTGDASYAYVLPKIAIPLNGESFQFAPVHNLSAAVNANYVLFDFGRLKANIDKSKQDLSLATHNVDYVKNQLASQVATVYYNISYLRSAIAIQDSVLAYLQDNKKMVESQLKNGTALKIDLLNIQASIDNEENRKVDLQNNLEKQFNLLEFTTGSRDDHEMGFGFEINLTDLSSALGIAATQHPDFLLARDRIKQAEADLAISKLAEKPVVGLRSAVGTKNGYVPYINDLRPNFYAGISFSIPIYNGGKHKQMQQVQQRMVQQQELAVETLNSVYRKELEQAFTDIASNLERIKNTAGQLEQARAAQVLAANRFKNGTGTNLEITNASTNVQRAALSRLQYQYQLCLAKIELARLMGYHYWE
jgi:outer membrane protein TolC